MTSSTAPSDNYSGRGPVINHHGPYHLRFIVYRLRFIVKKRLFNSEMEKAISFPASIQRDLMADISNLSFSREAYL